MHALAFRVMRLSQPDLPAEQMLALDVTRDFLPDDAAAKVASGAIDMDANVFARRVHASSPASAISTSGILELPQSFGTIYLGETFASYISVGNYSGQAVTNVVIKAELQSSRAKVLLYDTGPAPLPLLQPGTAGHLSFEACKRLMHRWRLKVTCATEGKRHDFLIRHDIKEISAYTLICSTSYTGADEDTAYQPQYFKFQSLNPLSVRTKIRTLQQQTLLEACVENCTDRPLLLAYVRFDATTGVVAVPVKREADASASAAGTPADSCANTVQVIDAGGGSNNFLYILMAEPGSRTGVGGPLGKLDIRWRSTLGKLGRLQTQQIMASAGKQKDAALTLLHLPETLCLEEALDIQLQVQSNVDRALGELVLRLPESCTTSGMVVQNISADASRDLKPFGSTLMSCTLLPLKDGLQRIPELQLWSRREDRVLDSLAGVDVFVH